MSKDITPEGAATEAIKPRVPKTEQELKQLAMDIADGKVFTDRHIREQDVDLLPSVFMPLFFIGQDGAQRMHDDDITVVYEYYDKAGPRSINEYPIFFSMNTLSRGEATIMWNHYEAYKEIKEKFQAQSDRPSDTGADISSPSDAG